MADIHESARQDGVDVLKTEARPDLRRHHTYFVAVGTYSSGEQVVSVMDSEGRSRSLSPDEADRMAGELAEAAAIVRAGRGDEQNRRWKIGGDR